jgi:hypothetical protein
LAAAFGLWPNWSSHGLDATQLYPNQFLKLGRFPHAGVIDAEVQIVRFAFEFAVKIVACHSEWISRRQLDPPCSVRHAASISQIAIFIQ